MKTSFLLFAATVLATLAFIGSVDAQRGLPLPQARGYEANAVILKQGFDLNPDGSYTYK